ncbi:MAG: BON domain-containing protein [Mycobacteriales bacterium]
MPADAARTPSLARRLAVPALAVAAVGGWLARRPTPAGRVVRRAEHRAGSRLRWVRGRSRHWGYALADRRPDPDVPDEVLAERVRAELGLVTSKLDLPRVHVAVEHHVVTLEGAVGDAADASLLQEEAMAVSGVRQVVSHLQEGLPPGINRPSQGAGGAPSPVLRALLHEVEAAGCPQAHSLFAVQRALTTFLAALPRRERRRVYAHLPYDVRRISVPLPHHPPAPQDQALQVFLDRAVHPDQIDTEHAEQAVRGVLRVLHGLDPHEAERIAPLLPTSLRELWEQGAQVAR